MRGIMNKKGAGHFEMVISFVFFIGFVLFLFIFLTPEDTTTLSGAVIEGLRDSFEEEAHTNLSSLFLMTDAGEEVDCFYVDLPENIFKYAINDGDSRVVKLSGEEVASDLGSGNLNVDNQDDSFRVAISPEFEDGDLGGCVQLVDYELGSVVERRVISYSTLEKMKDNYYDDYNNLRSKLGVPPIYDFAIIPEDIPSLEMKPRSGIPDSVDVMARDFVFGVLRSDGSLDNERINFRIW